MKSETNRKLDKLLHDLNILSFVMAVILTIVLVGFIVWFEHANPDDPEAFTDEAIVERHLKGK